MAGIADKIPSTVITEGNLKYLELYDTKLSPSNGLSVSPIHITPQQANKYIFNFHGLLDEIISGNLSFADKYFLTKVNGYDTSSDYDGKKLIIYTIDVNSILNK